MRCVSDNVVGDEDTMRWIKKVLLLVPGIIAGVILVSFLAALAKMSFRLDFSQSYRQIEGVENIVFGYGWKGELLQRKFWGLGKAKDAAKFNEHDKEEQQIWIEELKGYIHSDNIIVKAVPSPDGKYILYCEIEYNYYKSDMTDDEYCYYRVYQIETGKIVTIYQGYREWYDLDWQ